MQENPFTGIPLTYDIWMDETYLKLYFPCRNISIKRYGLGSDVNLKISNRMNPFFSCDLLVYIEIIKYIEINYAIKYHNSEFSIVIFDFLS